MELTEVAKLRRTVLKKIANYVWNDCLAEKVRDILYDTVTEDTPRLRCCVHKERAVLKNRIQMALGQKTGIQLLDAAKAALEDPRPTDLPVIDVLPDACDQCPIEKYYVTDMCRHCISHKCMANCPKKAITIHQDRAFINRDLCVECGKCRQSCPYGAIIEISRPCVRACALQAISAGEHQKAAIDYEKCVHCGNCRVSCPFGAIDERSMVVPLLTALKRGEKIVALPAPSFIGQFGLKTTAGQIVTALKKLGFTAVVETAVGADLTTIAETEEFLEKVPHEQPFMTSSCCPAFVELVKKHFPNDFDKVSKTVSPMVAAGRYAKEKFGGAKTCFIGPCIAKKAERRRNADAIDFVLTFEEMQCIFEGVGIDVAAQEGGDFTTAASTAGISFPLDRGVQRSVGAILKKRGIETKCDYAAGLERCHDQLGDLIKGKSDAVYFEGMACSNGCIDGPGAPSPFGVTRAFLTKFANAAPQKNSEDNAEAVTYSGKINLTANGLD